LALGEDVIGGVRNVGFEPEKRTSVAAGGGAIVGERQAVLKRVLKEEHRPVAEKFEGVGILDLLRRKFLFKPLPDASVGWVDRDVRNTMFGQEFERIGLKVKQLSDLNPIVADIVLEEFKAAVGYRAHPRFIATGIESIEAVAVGVGDSFENGAETLAIVCVNRGG